LGAGEGALTFGESVMMTSGSTTAAGSNRFGSS
jgi:hypothetical protein